MERIEIWCVICLALSILLAVWYWDPAWHCETMCSLHSKCFWQRCNVSWPFRRQTRSGHKVLGTAVCSVRELKYADICVCQCVTQYLSEDCNVSVPCLIWWPRKRSFCKQLQLVHIAKSGTCAFLKWLEKIRNIISKHQGCWLKWWRFWLVFRLHPVQIGVGGSSAILKGYVYRSTFRQMLERYLRH